MLHHTGTLWQYLGMFVLYTTLAIGLIYLAFRYARKHSGGLLPALGKKAGKPAPPLEIETTLPLEPRKNLYIVRAGQERFLLVTGVEGTQFLSKLEADAAVEIASEATNTAPAASRLKVVGASASQPKKAETDVQLPWFAQPEPPAVATVSRPSFGARFMQSLQWLAASRFKPVKG